MNSKIKQRIGSGIVADRVKFALDVIDLDDSKTILDIGSWHLNQSIEFSSIFPDANIYAFEPVPASFNNCSQKALTRPNISVYNLALSDFTGEGSFYAVDPSQSTVPNVGASSLLPFKEGMNGSFFNEVWVQKEIKTKISTLDAWCRTNDIEDIDIIWIDAQGAELKVFQGGDKMLEKTKIIFTEVGLKAYYEGHSLKPDIDAFLEGKGFQELTESFELNGFDYEGNTIYVNKEYLK